MKNQLKKSILYPEHSQILFEEQKQISQRLPFLKRYNIYLSGGTALALYLNHRTSIDFDFYTPNEFTNIELLTSFKRTFKNIKIIQDKSNTLKIK